MEELDIQRANLLPVAGTVTDNDMILIVQGGRAKRALPSAMKGKKGDPGLSAYLGVNATHILWKQGAAGTWQNLLEIEKLRGPKGEKPLFRKVGGTLQMKYEGEPDTAYVNIFDREELKMKFSDLTDTEVDQLKLHFSDLTDADKVELMKPATDAAKEVREQMDIITGEANSLKTDLRQLETIVEEEEEKRVNSYTQWQAAEQARQNDEQKRKEAESFREAAEELRDTSEVIRNERETDRQVTEAERQKQEGERIVEEQLRKTAEATRQTNETTRQTQEEQREQETVQAILDAENATGKANTAADRANTAAAGAEGLVKGFQSDWNVADPADPNYIKNKPEIPTLDNVPTGETLSYVNTDGTTVHFRIGDEVRVLEDGEYVFYKLYDLSDGVASWQESGSGTALPGNIYLQGANYYNESVTIIKEGYINE